MSPNCAEAKWEPKGGAGASGGTEEGVRSRKKTPGLKNMKVYEQMGRYYQVTHTVVQLTVQGEYLHSVGRLGNDQARNKIGDNGGVKCSSEIRCQWVSKIYLVRKHDERYTSKMSLSSLGLKELHTVQYVVGPEPSDKVL
jgi:hypothetical protein